MRILKIIREFWVLFVVLAGSAAVGQVLSNPVGLTSATGMLVAGSNATSGALDAIATAAGQTGGLKQTDSPTFAKVSMGVTTPSAPIQALSNDSVLSPDLLFVFNAAGQYRNSVSNTFNGTTPSSNTMDFYVADADPSAQTLALSLNGAGGVGVGGAVGGSSGTLTINVLATATGAFVCETAGLLSAEASTCVVSDQRLKIDHGFITPEMGLARTLALPLGHDFNFKDGYGAKGPMEGFFAQDVKKTRPDLVTTSAPTSLTPGGTLSVNYPQLVVDEALAIKALEKRIVRLERHQKR